MFLVLFVSYGFFGVIMKLIERILVVFVLFGVYIFISFWVCDFFIDSFVFEFVLKCCVFFFYEKFEIKYIGFEFWLMESKEMRYVLEMVKVNFCELLYSFLMCWNGSCDCNEVLCLNEE